MSSPATFTLDDYEHMIACGAFEGPHAKPLELIRGELRMMSPLGAEHSELARIRGQGSGTANVKSPWLLPVRNAVKDSL